MSGGKGGKTSVLLRAKDDKRVSGVEGGKLRCWTLGKRLLTAGLMAAWK